jgi:hypothetical protein
MIDQIDIDRAAFGLLRNHGHRAEYVCAELVERWEKRGDQEAARLWSTVLDVVRKQKRVG